MDFKEHIIEKIVDITGLEREVVEKSVEVPPDEKMGDIAFPCFPLAKVMRKAPPIIAQELAEKMSGNTAESVQIKASNSRKLDLSSGKLMDLFG